MKLGFLSAVLKQNSFEEVIDKASELGFKCVEMSCWPKRKPEDKRYGVTHINIDELNDEKIKYIKEYCNDKGVEISSLAYYPNNMDDDLEIRSENINHLKKLIVASSKLDVNMVTTFIGRDQRKSVEENIEIFKEVWPPIIKFAEEYKVKIAIENCPMLHEEYQWPGGLNLATTPNIWRQLFSIIDSDYFGLNYDPSHLVWQRIDYIKPIYEFKNKIFHVHLKDTKIDEDKLNDVGIMSYCYEYMLPKLPGLGDINWGKYISALTDIGYDSFLCIEVEDWAFQNSYESVINSLELSKRYIEQFVI